MTPRSDRLSAFHPQLIYAIVLIAASALAQNPKPELGVIVSANELLQDPFRHKGQRIILDCQIMAHVMDGATMAEVPYAPSPVPSMNPVSFLKMLDPDTALFNVRGANVGRSTTPPMITLGQIAVSVARQRMPRDQVPAGGDFSFRGLSTEGGWIIEPLGTIRGTNAVGGPVVIPHVRYWGFRTATTKVVKDDGPGSGGLFGRQFASYEEMETWQALNGQPPKLDWEGWKDRAEFDLYDAARNTQDLTKKLNLLKTWRATYPRSNYLAERYRLFKDTEAALSNSSGSISPVATTSSGQLSSASTPTPPPNPNAPRIWRSQQEFDAYNSPAAVAERKRQVEEAKREEELPALRARWAAMPVPPNCVRMDTVDIRPIVLSQVDADFSRAREKGAVKSGFIDKTLLIRIFIDERGEVMSGPYRPAVLESTGSPGIDETIVEAVLQWRFQPAHKSGQPVVTQANIEYRYRQLF